MSEVDYAVAEAAERIARAIEADREHFCAATKTPNDHPTALAFTIAARTARREGSNPMSEHTIDPCPECGHAVREVASTGRGERANYRAEPCRHYVRVTMHADRVQLEKP